MRRLVLNRPGACLLATLWLLASFYERPLWAAYRQDLKLEMRQTQYLTPAQQQTHRDQYADMIVRYDWLWEKDLFKLGADLGAVHSLNATGDNHLILPEAYVDWQSASNNIQVSVGRKLFSWSRFDDHWGLGLWQPHFRWDSIAPEAQGLTGGFVNISPFAASAPLPFRVVAFVSSVYLPDQDAKVDVVNGTLASQNRWFLSPVERVQVGLSSLGVDYRLDLPSASEVVDHSSRAIWAQLGDSQQGLWTQVGWARKPMNQLHVAFSAEVIGSGESIMATVHPEVVNHSLLTWEGGYSNDQLRAWASWTKERPELPDLPQDWQQAPLTEASFFGGAVAHRVRGWGLDEGRLTWSYLKRWDGSLLPGNGDQVISNDLFATGLRRFEFDEVASIQLQSKILRAWKKGLSAAVRYVYSMAEEGSLLSANLEFVPNRHWSWRLGLDVLGGSDVEAEGGFFSRHRFNDRVQGGLVYVF